MTRVRGLCALLAAQFMGAANDNILKALLSFAVVRGMWEGRLGTGGQGLIALCLFVPFILFSGWAGPLADRRSKRSIAVAMKALELPLAIVAALAFAFGNLTFAILAMVMLGTQSTFFSPAKYGMIPELVSRAHVSQANGLLNLTTNLAVIAGMLAAGIVSDRIAPDPVTAAASSPWLPGGVMLVVAIAGIAAILFLPRLVPLDPTTRVPLNPFASYARTMRTMIGTQLLPGALAWALFYLLATVTLLVVTELGAPLGVSDTQVAIMLAAIGVSLGIGSATSGFLSRAQVRLDFSTGAAMAMVAVLCTLGLTRVGYGPTLGLLCGLGVAAGFYSVPLQSLMQILPEPTQRGRVLATSNAISFGFMTLGSLAYWVGRPLVGTDPRPVLLGCAAVAVIAAMACSHLQRRPLESAF